MTRTTVAVSVALVAAVLVASFGVTAEAKITCDSCMKSGHPYLCKATMQSGACFNGAGDATCDGNGCVCCKKTAGPGCQSCDAADDDDEDDEDDE